MSASEGDRDVGGAAGKGGTTVGDGFLTRGSLEVVGWDGRRYSAGSLGIPAVAFLLPVCILSAGTAFRSVGCMLSLHPRGLEVIGHDWVRVGGRRVEFLNGR